MEPALAIPLHFTLELLGVASFGGLLAWAAMRRERLLAAGLGLLVLSQIAHAGRFVEGEAAGWVLGLRLAGLVLVAAGLHLRKQLGEQRATPAVAAAGMPGLAWATAVAAAVIAVGRRELPERRLWAAGWAAVAAAELWVGAGGGAAAPMDGGVGLHLLRVAGFLLLGIWAWHRSAAALRLRVVGAFLLVLFVVVVVAGGAAARVAAVDRQEDELRRLAVESRAQQAEVVSIREDLMRRAAVVSGAFATALDEQDDLNRVAVELHGVFPDLGFVALLAADGAVLGAHGLEEQDRSLVHGSEAFAGAFAGRVATVIETRPGELLAIGASPTDVDGPPAITVLGRPLDSAFLRQAVERVGNRVIFADADQVLVAARADFRGADVPAELWAEVSAGRIWRGTMDLAGERFLASAAPLAAEGEPVGAAVVVAVPDDVVSQTALDISRAIFGALMAAALLAVLIGMWMSRRIVRPVTELTTTARRVEEGDLAARSEVDRPDELGTLAGAFNSMTTTLRSTLASEQDTRRELETIVSGMGEALVAMDEDFNVVSFNSAAEEITGVGASEAIGMKCYDVYGHRTSGPEGKPICDYICPLRHSGGADGGVAFESADGEVRSLAVTCSTLRDDEGRIIGGVDLMRDVTREMQAERMKSSFLANISHELRTPLAPILGYAQLLRRKQVPRADSDRFLGEIIDSTRRLERIVTILADVAAMEAGRLRAAPQPVKPQELVRTAVDEGRKRAAGRPVRPSVARSLPAVEADPVLVGRALEELVDNALKFSPDGGPVVVRAEKAKGGVEFAVSDRGIGLEPEDVERLLEDFVQADPSETRRFGGLGVGLAFVRRVVDAHGSDLSVESRPGGGSTFSFVLPASRKRAAPRKQTRSAAKRGSSSRGRSPAKRGTR